MPARSMCVCVCVCPQSVFGLWWWWIYAVVSRRARRIVSPRDKPPENSPSSPFDAHLTWLEGSELTSQSHGFREREAVGRVVASGQQAFCVVSPLIALVVYISVHGPPPAPSGHPLPLPPSVTVNILRSEAALYFSPI